MRKRNSTALYNINQITHNNSYSKHLNSNFILFYYKRGNKSGYNKN
jgi:hypothetical protein